MRLAISKTMQRDNSFHQISVNPAKVRIKATKIKKPLAGIMGGATLSMVHATYKGIIDGVFVINTPQVRNWKSTVIGQGIYLQMPRGISPATENR